MSETENVLLAGLVRDKTFSDKTLPFIKEEYFTSLHYRSIFKAIRDYYYKFSNAPTFSSIRVDVESDNELGEEDVKAAFEKLGEMRAVDTPDCDWLVAECEKFCKDKAIFNAIQESISIYQGEIRGKSEGSIPELLSDAIAVCFDNRIGSDYLEDAEERYDRYQLPDYRVPFGLETLNEITNGGPPKKTFNVLVAGVNIGKSMMLIDLAANYLRDGKNVVYFSMEMSEDEVAVRVDANMLKVSANDVSKLEKDRYINKINALKAKTQGKLIVKEYPAHTGTAALFHSAIKEMWLKKKFKPDVILVDYIQITGSSRVLPTVGSYFYFKSVSEELRALAQATETVLWTAAQFKRETMNASDGGMEDIAESKAINDTADFMLGMFRTEELDLLQQILLKVLKTRYKKNKGQFFNLGVDIDKQTFYDVSGPVEKVGEKASSTLADQKMGSRTRARLSGINFEE